MYRGQQEEFKYVDLKRLWKFSKRNRIHENNKLHPHLAQMKKDEWLQDEIPGAEDTDLDPDDTLAPVVKIAIGAPPKDVIEESLLRIREELGLIKKNP
jgi:hypothetical protein